MAASVSTPYAEIRASLQTYDLIFFRGRELPGAAIAAGQEAAEAAGLAAAAPGGYTHVGVVVTGAEAAGAEAAGAGVSGAGAAGAEAASAASAPWLFEATLSGGGLFADGVPPLEGAPRLGAQLRSLDAIVAAAASGPAPSQVFWAPLAPRPRAALVARAASAAAILARYDGAPYASWCCCRGRPAYNCAELAAAVLADAGVELAKDGLATPDWLAGPAGAVGPAIAIAWTQPAV
jgi:hypothetical protein